MDNIKKGNKPAKNGWETGDAVRFCSKCKSAFYGSYKALRCEDCAYRRKNKDVKKEDMLNAENETRKHILKVQSIMSELVGILMIRSVDHDRSKLSGIELDVLAEFTPKLEDTTYGSDDYKKHLASMKPMLESHYSKNRHHPEAHKNGIDDMNLVDLLELMSDWAASSTRHKDGCIYKSLEINAKRFGISDQLLSVLKNTADLIVETVPGMKKE